MIKDGSLDALDFPAFTADNFGINAIDLWEGGLPLDKLDDEKYLNELKGRADKIGTDIFLLMSGALNADPKKSNFPEIQASLGRMVQGRLRPASAQVRRSGRSHQTRCRGKQRFGGMTLAA